MGSHVRTQNRWKTVFVLPFEFFPQAVGGQNGQAYGVKAECFAVGL